jgi:hypothetical protein
MGSKVQSKAVGAQKRNLNEMQPGIMRAQKREIQISHIKQITFSMELEVFFTIIQQTYSKTCYKFHE